MADALGISKQAVSQWHEDEAIPELHELRVRYELLPGVFPPAEGRKTA